MIPLIVRFGEKIPLVPPEVLRYDPKRQLPQVLEDGRWIDRIEAGGREGTTRVTCVQAETTDDA
jgi:hypothetical protein